MSFAAGPGISGSGTRPGLRQDQGTCVRASGNRGGQAPPPEAALVAVCLGQSPDHLGLINLMGSSSHPGPIGPGGRLCRTPAVNGVGEPCAETPHARFDGRALETGSARWPSAGPGPVC